MTTPGETDADHACARTVEAPPMLVSLQNERAARDADQDWLANNRLRPFLRALLRALSAWPV